jgi:hypothetical protein
MTPVIKTAFQASLGVLALLSIAGTTVAQGTAFTYQGQLKASGSPANGNYDMTFQLFDDPDAGTQQGGDIVLTGTPVATGLFTVELDFTDAPFVANQALWLATTVNGETLSPRQKLTPTPFALNTRGISVDAGGSVGIGTTTPSARLEIAGTPGVDGIKFPDGTLQTSATSGVAGFWSSSASDIFSNNAGSVGVGTSTPSAKLHVAGGPAWTTNGWTKSLALNNGTAIELGYGLGTRYGIGASNSQLYFFNTPTEATSAAASYFMTADSAGRIGIGTLAPAAKLDIAAIGDGASLLRLSTERPWSFRQKYTGSGSALQLIPDTGLKNFEISAAGGTNVATFVGDDSNPRVGIGTTNPTNRLHVLSNVNGSSAIYGQSTAGSSNSGVYGGSDATNGNGVIGDAPSGTTAYGVWGRATQGIGGVFSGGSLALWAQGRARVGILEITGGSDFSENFDVVNPKDSADAEVAPGMIVCIDAKTPGKLMVSNRPYDTTVAGIISGAGGVQVGMTMGQEGTLANGKHPVALTGRVYALCDASSGAIRPGDQLTTSDTPGHAMKSVDRERSQGAVVGKAMSSLPKGERGLVLVLVNLQ